MSTQAQGGAENAPHDMIPGRTPHWHTAWYRALAVVAAVLIALMIGVTCIDVVGRYLFNHPFGGAYELTQILLAALVFVALPLTSADGGHVEVDLALHLFPRPVQRGLGRLAGLVSALALGFFCWRLFGLGLTQLHEGTRSSSLALPMAPLAFIAAASCGFSALVLILRRED